MSGPRMNMSQMNGNNRRPPNVSRIPSCAQHDDIIKYIQDSWSKVSQEVERNSATSAVYYHEQEDQHLKGFQPFNLDKFLEHRGLPTHQHQHL